MKVREWHPDDIEQCTQLFNHTFGVNQTFEQSKWKFLRSPHRGQIPAFSIVAEEDSKIIGMYMSLPYELQLKGKVIQAIQVVDNCVDPLYRKKGVQLKMNILWKQLHRGVIDFAFGFPNTVAYLVGTASLGYQELFEMELLSTTPTDNGPSTFSFSKLKQFDKKVEEFWRTHSDPTRISVLRSTSYLTWRYTENPFSEFDSLKITEGTSVVGYAILRRFKDGAQDSAYLYELFWDQTVSYESVLTELLSYTCKSGISKLMLWEQPTSERFAAATRVGFKIMSGHTRTVVRVPFREPWLSEKDLSQSPKWYCTVGDSDFQ